MTAEAAAGAIAATYLALIEAWITSRS